MRNKTQRCHDSAKTRLLGWDLSWVAALCFLFPANISKPKAAGIPRYSRSPFEFSGRVGSCFFPGSGWGTLDLPAIPQSTAQRQQQGREDETAQPPPCCLHIIISYSVWGSPPTTPRHQGERKHAGFLIEAWRQ